MSHQKVDVQDTTEKPEIQNEKTDLVQQNGSGQPEKDIAVKAKSKDSDKAPKPKKAPRKKEEAQSPKVEDENQESIHTLKKGQEITGQVKNITSFGAFVDIGIAQDGLVHISEVARHKVDRVEDVLNPNDEVTVWVKKVDKKRGRISLTMVKPSKYRLRDIKESAEMEGHVTRLEDYGAFVDIGTDREGLVHISQMTHSYIKRPQDMLSIGDKVKVKVIKVNRKKRQIDLSMKALETPPELPKQDPNQKPKRSRKQKPKRNRRRSQRPQRRDKSNLPKPKLSDGNEPPVTTAMAVAYATALHDQNDSKTKAKRLLEKGSADEISKVVAETLASS